MDWVIFLIIAVTGSVLTVLAIVWVAKALEKMVEKAIQTGEKDEDEEDGL